MSEKKKCCRNCKYLTMALPGIGHGEDFDQTVFDGNESNIELFCGNDSTPEVFWNSRNGDGAEIILDHFSCNHFELKTQIE